MMWGDDIRKTEDGRGIPKITRITLETYVPETRAWVGRMAWEVLYPDPWEWDCCGQTEFQWCDTWSEALSIALRRVWER